MLGGRLEVTPAAREVAAAALPAARRPHATCRLAGALVTLGLPPPSIRDEYGFPWSPARDRALAAFALLVRRTLPLTPGFVRYWPLGVSRRA
jgi:uncharacterized protein (DUF2236 family)